MKKLRILTRKINILRKTAMRVLSAAGRRLAWWAIDLLEWSPRRALLTKLYRQVTEDDRHARLDGDRR